MRYSNIDAKKSKPSSNLFSKLNPTSLLTIALQNSSRLSETYLLKFSNKAIFSPPPVTTEKISLFCRSISYSVLSNISAKFPSFCRANNDVISCSGLIIAVPSLNSSISSSNSFLL